MPRYTRPTWGGKKIETTSKIKTECTWGDGPDVLVCIYNHPILLMEPPSKLNRCRDGLCYNSQLDLTSEEALKLAYSLINSARQAQEIDRLYAEEYEGEVNE